MYYPEQSVTVTSSDPPYVTPVVKYMLRQNNKLLRSGRIEKAAALATKIGLAIEDYNSAELSRVNVMSNAKSMWSKVRQLTGRSKHLDNCHSTISAEVLNDHYATISTDVHYTVPRVKSTCNNCDASSHVSEWQIFNILDTLRPTSTGLDNIPAWFLRTGSPIFAAPLADIMNLSLSTSTVPKQWKSASILPVAKVAAPDSPADYRPISNTSVISRILERIVVRDFIYPSLRNRKMSGQCCECRKAQ